MPHHGEMQEWLNWHAWKACVLQKGTGGSNPPLSATPDYSRRLLRDFCFYAGPDGLARVGRIKNKKPIERSEMGVIRSYQDPPKGITGGNPTKT